MIAKYSPLIIICYIPVFLLKIYIHASPMSTFFSQNILERNFTFTDWVPSRSFSARPPQTRLRGIEHGFFGAPAETVLNNPLEGTQPVKIYRA
jgi:hypothetical protein